MVSLWLFCVGCGCWYVGYQAALSLALSGEMHTGQFRFWSRCGGIGRLVAVIGGLMLVYTALLKVII